MSRLAQHRPIGRGRQRVYTVPSGRSAVAIIATDALYGGVAGTLIAGESR